MYIPCSYLIYSSHRSLESQPSSSKSTKKQTSTDPPTHPQPKASTTSTKTAGPRVQLINGRVVLDESSLVVDMSHLGAAAAAAAMESEEAGRDVVDETDGMGVHVTAASFGARKMKGRKWSSEDTELFFKVGF
jgi:hypothetical protein